MKELTQDIIQWDIKTWSKALDYWDKNIDWNTVQNGLELGSAQGGLSLWLALKGKETLCSDLKDAKTRAEQLHIKYNVSSLIKYQDIDATQIPYENFFDIVVFKSIVGGIGEKTNINIQQKVFDEIYKALKPGGKLLFAENLIASPLHQFLRKRFVKWGNSWRYISIQETKEFLKMFSSYNFETTGVVGVFGRTEKQRHMFSAIDEIVLNKICPNSWDYIIYGIAEK